MEKLRKNGAEKVSIWEMKITKAIVTQGFSLCSFLNIAHARTSANPYFLK